MSNRKRPAASKASSGGKKIRAGGAMSLQSDPVAPAVSGADAAISTSSLKQRFIQLFQGNHGGVSNSSLKSHFGETEYPLLVPIINELTAASRLTMSKAGHELFYTLVSDDIAAKFQGLDTSARMVYQVIEKSGNMGCWTKDIRIQTSIQQNTLSKILKSLETRRLIKPVKSVTAKAKKLYMIFDLQPSKELTGGVWYSDLEFDHEFISELRNFLLHCIRRLNGGQGVSLQELHDRMVQAKVSRVTLSLEELKQLLQTLVYDYMVEEVVLNCDSGTSSSKDHRGGGDHHHHGDHHQQGVPVFVQARRISVPCEFKWWEALEPDFHFRTIAFEDGVKLAPHEPHHHTA